MESTGEVGVWMIMALSASSICAYTGLSSFLDDKTCFMRKLRSSAFPQEYFHELFVAYDALKTKNLLLYWSPDDSQIPIKMGRVKR